MYVLGMGGVTLHRDATFLTSFFRISYFVLAGGKKYENAYNFPLNI